MSASLELALGIERGWQFLAAAALMIVVPGPATLFVAGRAQRVGAGATRAALGIVTGDLMLMALSAAGFAAVVARWPALITAISIAGAAYLAHLGVGMLRSTAAAAARDPDSAGGGGGGSSGFVRGALVALTNPKPILFFATFFPAFIAPDAPSRLRAFAVLGALFESLNLIYFAVVIAAVARLGRAALAGPRSSIVRRLSGAGLLVFAITILVAALR